MDMKERLQELAEAARKRIEESDRPERLNEVKVNFLGKKGQLTSVLKKYEGCSSGRSSESRADGE